MCIRDREESEGSSMAAEEEALEELSPRDPMARPRGRGRQQYQQHDERGDEGDEGDEVDLGDLGEEGDEGDEGEEESEGEGEEVVLESDPDIDPYERSAAEEAKYETLHLKVVHERGRTGFEEHKDFPIRINSLIAARYQVREYLGSAAFSKAVQCIDLHSGELVCIKIIKNNKDFFDQVRSLVAPC